MEKFKCLFKLNKSKKISSYLLRHIASSKSSLTSYALIKSMYHLPFESSQAFLAEYDILDHQHFFEHLSILKSNLWLKELVSKQLLTLTYPAMMLISSTLLFHIFHFQFQPILQQMNLSISFESIVLKVIHIFVLISSLLAIFSFFWINRAMYRKILCIQIFRKTRLIRSIMEWEFMSVVNSVQSLISVQSIITLMKCHTNNPVLSILSFELKEHIEQGENMVRWIEKLSINPTMSLWLEDQINNQHFQNCGLWQKQLEFAIQHHFTQIKFVTHTFIYILIAFNIMGMISLLTLPYEWMVNL
jgi:hypothetical protein